MPEAGATRAKRRGRIAVLVSGSGSNLEAILTAQEKGQLPADVVSVISSRPGVAAIDRATRRNIPAQVIDPRRFSNEQAFEEALLSALVEASSDVVCLAGYLRKLGPRVIERYRGRILNIHPALLPKYGGPGMWGRRVHEAVLAAGDKESGCSVHLVDEEFDHGEVLAQTRVPVEPGDTPSSLAARVLEAEHRLYPSVIKSFCENHL